MYCLSSFIVLWPSKAGIPNQCAVKVQNRETWNILQRNEGYAYRLSGEFTEVFRATSTPVALALNKIKWSNWIYLSNIKHYLRVAISILRPGIGKNAKFAIHKYHIIFALFWVVFELKFQLQN
jgi:hypothetical protein